MKLKHSKFDFAMDILSLAVVVGTAVFLTIRQPRFPVTGGPDLLIPMAFSWVFFALLTVVEWFPKIWNTGIAAVTEENRERVYAALLHLITSTKLIITAFFSWMALAEDFPAWCVLAGLALMLVNLVYWLTRLEKAK